MVWTPQAVDLEARRQLHADRERLCPDGWVSHIGCVAVVPDVPWPEGYPRHMPLRVQAYVKRSGDLREVGEADVRLWEPNVYDVLVRWHADDRFYMEQLCLEVGPGAGRVSVVRAQEIFPECRDPEQLLVVVDCGGVEAGG